MSPNETLRIFSDVHYGERSSRVRSLAQLRPLCDGAGSLLVNGDMLDTRAGPHPDLTAQWRAEVAGFFAGTGVPATFVTGNHDPDISGLHACDLAGGEVFATHGDILFDSIVPWGRDAAVIRRRMITALAALPERSDGRLEARLAALRQVAATIRQRHQSERNGVKYTLRFAIDTMWPPRRMLNVLRAWRELPRRAASLTRQYRPKARFVLVGHTHRPGVWPTLSGVVVINTGAFCVPFGAFAVDLSPGRMLVRRVVARRGAFHPGEKVAEFPLSI